MTLSDEIAEAEREAREALASYNASWSSPSESCVRAGEDALAAIDALEVRS